MAFAFDVRGSQHPHDSKLKFPKTDGVATVRNINTVAKLVAIAEETAASKKPAR